MGFLQFHHFLFLQNQISLFQLIAKALKCERFVAAAWLQDKQSATQCHPTTDLKKSADCPLHLPCSGGSMAFNSNELLVRLSLKRQCNIDGRD
jgi:hypothetical protein